MFIRSPKDLALFINNHRKKLGLSQAEVADRVGLKQKTISAFENKPESTEVGTLFQILSAVNLDLEINPKPAMDELMKVFYQNNEKEK